MLEESQQYRLYREWIGAQTRALFFAEKASRSLVLQRHTLASLCFSSGAVVTLAAKLDPIFPSVFSVMTALVSAYSLVAQNQNKAVDAADLHSKWNKLSMEYARLWERWYTEEAVNDLDGLRPVFPMMRRP